MSGKCTYLAAIAGKARDEEYKSRASTPRHLRVPQPGVHMLRSARLQKLAGTAVFAGAGAAILCSPATQCETEQRKGTGPLQRRSSVSDSINVVRADMSLAGAINPNANPNPDPDPVRVE